MIFISPPKSGTSSLGQAMKILGYTPYGWNQDIFSIDEYIIINHHNKITAYLKEIDYKSNAVLDIQKSFGFVKSFVERSKADCFHDYPLGHECFDPFLKKIIFPKAKFIYSIRKPELLYDSVRRHYFLSDFSDEYFKLSYDAYEARYWLLKNQFDKDVLFYEIGSGWESLCEFLNKKIPKENFPIENRFVDKN